MATIAVAVIKMESALHQPADLAGFERCGAVVGGAGFQSIQPVGRFRASRDYYERKSGPRSAYSSQKRQALCLVSTCEYDIGVNKIVDCNTFRASD